jgi:hypothetical protein
MAGSITDFLGSFTTDFARSSRFDVQINVPVVLFPFTKTSRQLTFRCQSADLPGRTLSTTERKIGAAPIRKIPYQTTYNESNLTFIVSDDMSEKILFESWIEAINPTTTYNFSYPANYVSDIIITQYDVQNNPSYQVVLQDAFPIAVNQMDLDWTTENPHKLAVVFAYTQWQSTSIKSVVNNLETQIINSIIQ